MIETYRRVSYGGVIAIFLLLWLSLEGAMTF